MARKHKHEEHANHEAWAIPYGDLVTLLLAFFVVMYAVSSINEGKYRVLADALSASFGGPPKSVQPVQVGHQPVKGAMSESNTSPTDFGKPQPAVAGRQRDVKNPTVFSSKDPVLLATQQMNAHGNTGYRAAKAELTKIGLAIERALGELVKRDQIRLRRNELSLEIEMNTDILFPSGSATISPAAHDTLFKLAEILSPFSQTLRIEGHTDNVPISTYNFPSNWELSSARAASVVHLFQQNGVAPQRMMVAGMGEYRPVSDNDSVESRNRNRRVVVVVLASPDQPFSIHDADVEANGEAQIEALQHPAPAEDLEGAKALPSPDRSETPAPQRAEPETPHG